MRVLVTGANGMLGLDLCAMLTAAGHDVIRTDVGIREGAMVPDWQPLDITSPASVEERLNMARPDHVIHTAACTDVDGCERNPDRAYLLNAQGTWNLAALCARGDIPLTYISTDFVFDGEQRVPYTEFDIPNPLSHYGASKLAGENYVRSLCRRHFVTRSSWLFGTHGPTAFPTKILALAQSRKELQIVCDQTGSPTYTRELARILIGQLDSPLYGTYHVCNQGACTWYDFAREVLRQAGVAGVEVHPVPASQWPSPTRRPAYSVMRRYALELQGKDDLKPWQAAVSDYLQHCVA